jgi:uncharacterized protein
MATGNPPQAGKTGTGTLFRHVGARCRRGGGKACLSRFFLLAGLLGAVGAGALEVPYMAGRVNDLAELIDAEREARIEAKLAELEQRTGAQVAILTVESLEGEPLEDYSLRVAQTWGLGREAADDGVLLLIAEQDRKMRLEVGYGLEGTLTDALSGRILDNVLRPRFRAGQFGEGIEEAAGAVEAVVSGNPAAVPDLAPSSGSDLDSTPWPARLLFFGVYLVVVGIFSVVALFSKGAQSWFLYVFLMPFHLAFPVVLSPFAGPLFFGAWLLGFPIVKSWLGKSDSGKRFLARHPGWTTFAASSRSGGGGWSSSGGGGGFSGGGGSFGGGGASSSW